MTTQRTGGTGPRPGLVHPMDRRMSRRLLLARMAGLSAAAALGSVAAACSSAGSTAGPTAGPTAAPATGAPSAEATAEATAAVTPAPTPESELYVYNYADYIGDTVVPDFEKKHGVKVTYDFFDTYDTMTAKIGSGDSGYDITFATSTDIPGFLERGLIQPLDLSLIPNRANLAAEWEDPSYDPGNLHSMPYMWWTTGVGYDTERIGEELDSWAALWDPRWKGHISMLDDYREAFAAALIRLGKSINTTDDAELDAALALLKEQKPLLRTYTTDDIGQLSSGDSWVVHSWGSDVYQVTGERPSVTYYIPSEGGVRGSDTMVLLGGAKHPIAANTNYIGYMGPNEAAKEFIDPAILADPAVNPDKAAIALLQEIDDLGPDLEKYATRWNELRAGG
ncbi:MAG: spermidine/putrescine ABC transporter substrate-binding protein [Chloroflexi bacterium]|nr:spermidine/putrescine ABC transporter substrate-binding protein [Chloroflexota bacterium]